MQTTAQTLSSAVNETMKKLTDESGTLETFNYGIKDGVRGFFTNPSRADDSFIPFKLKNPGSEYLRYNADTNYIQAMNEKGNWSDVFYTLDFPILSFTGNILSNGVLNQEEIGSITGNMSFNGTNLVWSGSGAVSGSHSQAFKINKNFKTCTILCSGTYSIGAYRKIDCYFQILNATTGSVVKSVCMGSHDNGYHDPYGIETFSFSASYQLSVSDLAGEFKVRFIQLYDAGSVSCTIKSIIFS